MHNGARKGNGQSRSNWVAVKSIWLKEWECTSWYRICVDVKCNCKIWKVNWWILPNFPGFQTLFLCIITFRSLYLLLSLTDKRAHNLRWIYHILSTQVVFSFFWSSPFLLLKYGENLFHIFSFARCNKLSVSVQTDLNILIGEGWVESLSTCAWSRAFKNNRQK